MQIETKYYEEMVGDRLDFAIADYLDDISRSKVAKAIKAGKILVNGKEVKTSYLLKEDDLVQVDLAYFEPVPIQAEDIPLDILFEDDDLLIINKQAGLIVHPTSSVRSGTLVNALLNLPISLSTVNGEERLGIVHRLDCDTSGALIIAKNDESHFALQEQFQDRQVKKVYHTILEDNLGQDVIEVKKAIGRNPSDRKLMMVSDEGKSAYSIFSPLKSNDRATYSQVEILTGRTHQIRVHAAYLKHPVIGDRLYGFKKQRFKTKRQLLHAYQIEFTHPKSGERLAFQAPLPKDFTDFLEKNKLN